MTDSHRPPAGRPQPSRQYSNLSWTPAKPPPPPRADRDMHPQGSHPDNNTYNKRRPSRSPEGAAPRKASKKGLGEGNAIPIRDNGAADASLGDSRRSSTSDQVTRDPRPRPTTAQRTPNATMIASASEPPLVLIGSTDVAMRDHTVTLNTSSNPLVTNLLDFSNRITKMSISVSAKKEAQNHLKRAVLDQDQLTKGALSFPSICEYKAAEINDADKQLQSVNSELSTYEKAQEQLAMAIAATVGNRPEVQPQGGSSAESLSRVEYEELSRRHRSTQKDMDALKKDLQELLDNYTAVKRESSHINTDLESLKSRVDQGARGLKSERSDVAILDNLKATVEQVKGSVSGLTAPGGVLAKVQRDLTRHTQQIAKFDALQDKVDTVKISISDLTGPKGVVTLIKQNIHEMQNEDHALWENAKEVKGSIPVKDWCDTLEDRARKTDEAIAELQTTTKQLRADLLKVSTTPAPGVDELRRQFDQLVTFVKGIDEDLSTPLDEHSSLSKRLFVAIMRVDSLDAEQGSVTLLKEQIGTLDGEHVKFIDEYNQLQQLFHLNEGETPSLFDRIEKLEGQQNGLKVATEQSSDDAAALRIKALETHVSRLDDVYAQIGRIDEEAEGKDSGYVSPHARNGIMHGTNASVVHTNLDDVLVKKMFQDLQARCDMFTSVLQGVQNQYNNLTSDELVRCMVDQFSTLYPQAKHFQRSSQVMNDKMTQGFQKYDNIIAEMSRARDEKFTAETDATRFIKLDCEQIKKDVELLSTKVDGWNEEATKLAKRVDRWKRRIQEREEVADKQQNGIDELQELSDEAKNSIAERKEVANRQQMEISKFGGTLMRIQQLPDIDRMLEEHCT